ncbi:MAG: 3-hydroxyacyl-ACP dehydratase FabZ [Acidimicrobiales bacterium]
MDPRDFIPHREPFLLVDEVLEVVPGVSAVGRWTPLESLEVFRGHFPGRPTLPGVYMVESLAQLGACAVLSLDAYRETLPLFGGIDRARFRAQVGPGETLDLSVEMRSLRARAGKGYGVAKVGTRTACEVEFFFVIG